jgi:hypothetical protein
MCSLQAEQIGNRVLIHENLFGAVKINNAFAVTNARFAALHGLLVAPFPCAWRIAIYAAIGSWISPSQCDCQV